MSVNRMTAFRRAYVPVERRKVADCSRLIRTTGVDPLPLAIRRLSGVQFYLSHGYAGHAARTSAYCFTAVTAKFGASPNESAGLNGSSPPSF